MLNGVAVSFPVLVCGGRHVFKCVCMCMPCYARTIRCSCCSLSLHLTRCAVIDVLYPFTLVMILCSATAAMMSSSLAEARARASVGGNPQGALVAAADTASSGAIDPRTRRCASSLGLCGAVSSCLQRQLSCLRCACVFVL